MKQFFMLFFAAVTVGTAQSDTAFYLLDYRLTSSINERVSEITGRLTAVLQSRNDSILHWSFDVPQAIEINSVTDADENSYRIHRKEQQSAWYHYTIDFPSPLHSRDSVAIIIEFSETIDSSGSAPLFVNAQEFLLPYTSAQNWLPLLHETAAASGAIELSADSGFTIVAEAEPDSIIRTGDRTVWKWHASPAPLQHLGTLCGSKNIATITHRSDDSLTAISFLFHPDRFNESFARAAARQLTGAAEYFSNLCGRNGKPLQMKFIFIGDDDIDESYTKIGRMVIERNSPKHTVFDSTIYTRSANNPFLYRLAEEFTPVTSDSDAVLSIGWTGYLVTRYLLSANTAAAVAQRERLDCMVSALTFFPSAPLNAGRSAAANSDEILSSKGRYFFLMLEYLIGKESFDSVAARMFRQAAAAPVTVNEFRNLCEQEYGSSLEWFFRQWLTRSSAPEFVMQWKSETTLRGIHLVTVVIEQRGELYSMPVPLVFTFGNRNIAKRVIADQYRQEYSFQFAAAPSSVSLDPQYMILRWLLETRILAHARSSRLFRIYNKDLVSSEKEARLALQLDPDNNTGTAPIAYFSLAKIAVIRNDLEQAKELFVSAMQSSASDEAALYPLLSLVRYGNVVEMEGHREDAVAIYQRAIAEGQENPLLYAPVIIEAEKYLRENFISAADRWYGFY
ncbi:MAG: hypothetical protein WCT99_06365 [Bacteroidota bacterium]